MNIRSPRSWVPLACLMAVGACGGDSGGPSAGPATGLSAGVDLSRSAAVGVAVPNGVMVHVTDAAGRSVPNVAVAFAVTRGNGSVNPRVALTDAKGDATAAWTLGTVVGPNEVTASVTGVTAALRFAAAGTAGPVSAVTVTPQSARLLPSIDSLRISAQSLDAFGNPASPAPTFVVRDPSLISVDSGGLIRALRRGNGTYVIATAAGKSDSILVTVLAAGQSVCTAAADPMDLSVGQVVTGVSGAGLCVHASSANAEYALIPYFDSPGVPTATVALQIRGQGLTSLPLPSATVFSPTRVLRPEPALVPNDAFESALRDRERQHAQPRAAAAQAWYGANRDLRLSGAAAAPVVPSVGDLLMLNANAIDYCDKAVLRAGRVVAITDKAIVVADTANPAGGFTDEEYRSIGVTFDTLVDPVDRAAFGAPTDIDNNGHVILFFTRAVNELTSAGSSGGVVLGFFYSRDLLPKTAAPGPCAGSNAAEMFYLMVPDTGGAINGNRRSKPTVVSFTNGTVAHEYQHLINASRRLYVNGAGSVSEEKWLDEGLAHVAEELNFFRASGRRPRANLDATGFSDPKFVTAYGTFQNNNLRRYATYLQRTETQAPIGADMFDDDLQTRGAIWSFLRYTADRLPDGQENAFWFKLVNSTTSGIANLTNALGGSPNALFRDWAISVYMDDNAPNVDARFQQPSWNLRSTLTGGGASSSFPLITRILADNTALSFTLLGNAVSFDRFSVPRGQDALLTVTANGQALPATVLLAVVRVR